MRNKLNLIPKIIVFDFQFSKKYDNMYILKFKIVVLFNINYDIMKCHE